jgi:hypothetical protein
MRRFGYEDLPEKLHGAGIHSLDNLMTLEYNIQIWFDELKLWFEAVVCGLQFFGPCALTVRRTAKKIPIIFV